jgi:hypothetical protein
MQPTEVDETEVLTGFLEETDVSSLPLKAAKLLSCLTEHTKMSIQSTLTQWDDVQAVSNLLQHPMLIEETNRLTCLLKGRLFCCLPISGLQEKEEKYLVLSAIVGLQGLTFVQNILSLTWQILRRNYHRDQDYFA